MTAATTRLLSRVRTGPRGAAPIVLVHAAGLDLTYWDVQIERLSTDHDVVAVDMPGHGNTPGTGQDWTLESLTGSLAATVHDLGAGPVHLVGVSMGSMVGQAFALARPDLVRSLTLVGTVATFPDAGRTALRNRAQVARDGGMQAILDDGLTSHWFVPEFAARRPDLVARTTATLLSRDPQVQAAMWDMIASFETLSDLSHIDRPTLVMVGERDVSTPPSAAEMVRRAIPAPASA